MTSVVSTYQGNLWLAQFQVGSYYLACHETDPGVAGDRSTELGGGGYARQPISFGAPSGKALLSSNSQTFTGLLPTEIEFFAVWDDPVAGNLRWTIALSPALTPNASGQIVAAAGDVGIQL